MRLWAAFLCLFTACSFGPSSTNAPSHQLPAWNEDGELQVVVEIPAGTNKKLEYNNRSDTIEQDTQNGMPRVVDFLPYPGNYGFVPSTYMDEERGGDGDALDILVLAEHVPVGTVMAVEPVAMLELLDQGEVDNKLIAIPAELNDRSVQVLDLDDFLAERPEITAILEKWFLSYKGPGKMEMVTWKGRRAALDEVARWQLNGAGKGR